MLHTPQEFSQAADFNAYSSELNDEAAYAKAAEARRIVEIAVFWVFGAGKGTDQDIDDDDCGQAGPSLAPTRHAAMYAAMYLAHIACGMSLTDVGRLYARDRTTVAYACAVIEDRRDDPEFDQAMELLECAVSAMAARPAAYQSPF
jgi:hypothetical protein